MLVKAGFTNLEGLRDADVSDFVDILAVDEAKAQEIHAAVHQETKHNGVRVNPLQAMSRIFRNTRCLQKRRPRPPLARLRRLPQAGQAPPSALKPAEAKRRN